jgi:carbon-monoxide dehydrogenase small subunit
MPTRRLVHLTINGQQRQAEVEPRKLLADFIREDLGLTGTHLGCEHGVCGAFTILMNGKPIRSCLVFAVQAEGSVLETVEGLAPSPEVLHPIQQAFWEEHALQCGFCTPGFVLSVYEYLRDNPSPQDEGKIREALAGNLCRCTGYVNIVQAVRRASSLMREGSA